MSNPEYHTCPDCGYQWRHGHNGSHSCVRRLVARVKELEMLNDNLFTALKEIAHLRGH